MISWQQIHSDRHNYRSGEVVIDQAFTGNVLSVQVETKPEYDLSRQIIGWLYQYSGLAIKKFALISGNDVLFLALPETDKLEFIPTPYLNELYTLTINAANIEGSNNSGISGSIPDAILALPNRVLAVENGLTGATNLLSQLQSDLSDLESTVANLNPSTSWANITGKPSTFAPSAHGHAITDITSLQAALDGKSNTGHTHAIGDVNLLQSSLDNLSGSISSKANQSDLTALSGRVTTLESGSTATFPQKVKLNGTGNRGLFWYLGTLGTDEDFIDPITRGSITGLMSSVAVANITPKNALDRVSPVFATNDESGSWLGFDLGSNRSILIDRYLIKARTDNNFNHLRNWVLQGTNSVSANTVSGFNTATWTAIDTQSSFTGLTGISFFASFVPSIDTYFRYIRLRQSGLNSSNLNTLTLSVIEFFGVLKLTA